MGRVQSLEAVLKAVEDVRAKGKTVVATNGCFDILHVGHVRNLEDAKALGDVLIVGINSDESVRWNKGVTRPIVPAEERAEIIAALSCVDYVFIFPEQTPFSWIQRLRPEVHAKGGGEDIVNHPDLAEQRRLVEVSGGRLVLLPHHDGRSTSTLIQRIKGES